MNPFKLVLLTTLVSICFPTYGISQSYYPKLLEPVTIQEIQVIQNPLNKQAVELIISYTPAISIVGNFTSSLPETLSFASGKDSKRQVSLNVSFIKEIPQTKRLNIILNENTSGIIHFSIDVPDAPDGYMKSVTRWVKLKNKSNKLTIINPRKPAVEEPLEIGKDIIIIKGDRDKPKTISGVQSQINQNYSVSVSGKIQFKESNTPTFKGLYKNGVALWFRNSSNPGTWYHPVYSSSGDLQNVHYDILDEQGNFSFNFNFTGDLTGYNELIVLVNTANDAVIAPVSQDGYFVQGGSGYTAYYNESEGIEVSISPSQTNIVVNQNGEVAPDNGKILRYAQLSKDYLESVYSGSVPFGMPHIPIRVNNLNNKCGVFSNSWSFLNGFNQSIEIDPDCTETSTVSHEFGHWVNYRMWTNNERYTSASLELKEGWAVFYSFGMRNYANDKYGDLLRIWDDNAEEDAFQTGTNDSGNPYRYRGMRYPYSGEVGVGALASFMWSAYDDRNTTSNEAAQYKGKDNDDVEGYKVKVFQSMRHSAALFAGHDEYIAEFRSGLPNDVKTSVDLIEDFMYDSFTSVPSIRAKPSQISALNFTATSSQINIDWNNSNYSSGNFKNEETGYKIYSKSGSTWNYLGSTSISNKNFSTSIPNTESEFKVTSYNSSGESLKAPSFFYGPLMVDITGPSYLEMGESGMFFATGKYGATPYENYYWYKRPFGGNWTYVGTGQSKNISFNYPSGTMAQIKVTLEDLNLDYADGFKNVNIYNDCGDPQEPGEICEFSKVKSLPEQFELSQNYPNPFNPSTQINFELPDNGEVSIKVYNIMGQEVATLLNKQMRAGYHNATFEASNLASGLYIARLKVLSSSGTQFVKEIKMQLIK